MANGECRSSDTSVSPCELHLLILFCFLLLVHVTGEQQGDVVTEDQRKSNNDCGTSNIESSRGTQESRDAGSNNLHRSCPHLHGSVREVFNNTKHEVPSGPNPISNR